MKLTIDTQHDSYEDIRKVLHILTQILERKGETGSGEAVDTANLMGMFDSSSDATRATGASSLLNLGKTEKKAAMERVEVY